MATRYAARAESALARGERSQAQIWWANALRHQPTNAALWRRVAGSLRTVDPNQTLDAGFQAFLLDSSDEGAAKRLVDDAMEAGRPQPAAVICLQVLRRDSNQVAWLQRLGGAYAAMGRTDEALRAYDAVLALEGTFKPARHARAVLLLGSPDPAVATAARAVVDEMRWERGFERSATLNLVRSLGRVDPAMALARADEWLAVRPDDWALRVEWLLLRNRLRVAGHAEDLSDLWARASDPGQRLQCLSLTLRLEGTTAAGLALDRIPPGERTALPVVLIELECLAADGRWPEAAQLAEQGLKLPGDDTGATTVHAWRYRVRQMSGDTTAGGELEAIKAIAGRDMGCALAAAVLLESWGFHADAARVHQVVGRQEGPAADVALDEALRCAVRARDGALALEIAEERLRRAPDDAMCQNNAATLLLATRQSPRRAVLLAQKALAQRPNDPVVQETLGRTDEARALVREVAADRLLVEERSALESLQAK